MERGEEHTSSRVGEKDRVAGEVIGFHNESNLARRPPAGRHGNSGATRESALANRPHDVAEQVLGELAAHLFADFQRIAEMNAAPDAYHPLLFGHLPDAVELTLQPGIGTIGHREYRQRSSAEHRFEDAG